MSSKRALLILSAFLFCAACGNRATSSDAGAPDAAGLGDASTAGCTVANCQAMSAGCRLTLCGAVPNNSACLMLLENPDAGGATVDFNAYCVDRCEHTGQGPIVECIASLQQTCETAFLDGGPTALPGVYEACLPPSDGGSGTPDPTCTQGCDSVEQLCFNSCPTTSAKACYDCSYPCAATWCDCYAACPTI